MSSLTPIDFIERCIYVIRGQRVMVDADLATLYGVETKVLNQAVKRNVDRFPSDFMFQLAEDEARSLRSRIVTSNDSPNRRPSAGKGSGGRRYLPYAFTEQGVAMLSSVLKSPQAIHVNIGIMRAFVHLREMLASNAELAQRLDEMEKKYDSQFKTVFEAIRHLMMHPDKPTGKIGFKPKGKA